MVKIGRNKNKMKKLKDEKKRKQNKGNIQLKIIVN